MGGIPEGKTGSDKWQEYTLDFTDRAAAAAETFKAGASPFYDELQGQGTYLPAHAPQFQPGFNYGHQVQQVQQVGHGQDQMAEYAIVLPLFLLICFLFTSIACFATICCGAAGYVFGKRSRTSPQLNKVRAFEV